MKARELKMEVRRAPATRGTNQAGPRAEGAVECGEMEKLPLLEGWGKLRNTYTSPRRKELEGTFKWPRNNWKFTLPDRF